MKLDDLQEFVSTGHRTRESVPTLDGKGKRKSAAVSQSISSIETAATPIKRPKLDFALGPKVCIDYWDLLAVHLIMALQQYHYYPYPIIRKSPDMKAFRDRVPPFDWSTATFLHPHTEDDIRSYLNQPFATSAWLVPVRGRMPWFGVSEATIVDEEDMKEGMDPIIWTRTGLKKFWEFLITVYESQTVGPLSLSLHIATKSSGDNSGGVLDQDHIKIRHDASLALYIRTMLDVWKYSGALKAEDGTGDGSKRRFRPLHHARLIFVNDCSEGLMVL